MTSSAGLKEALDAFRRGDLDQARALAQVANEARTSPQVQHLLGLIECRSGRLAAGIDWLRKSSEAEPGNIGYRVMVHDDLDFSQHVEKTLAAVKALKAE